MGSRKVDQNEANRKAYSIDEWNSCGRKNNYRQDEARGQARRLNRKRSSNDYVFRTYHCTVCGWWHVGRQYVETRKRRKRKDRLCLKS